MSIKHKIKVPHMIRYSLVLSLVGFFLYWKGLLGKWILLWMGPILYLSAILKNLLGSGVKFVSGSPETYFGLVLPLTLFYFVLFAFLLKKLWAEQGLIKGISIVGALGCLGYVHYLAWMNLQGYYLPPY